MTHDEINRIARESGFVGFDSENRSLRRFAELVAATEREACAKLAQETICDTHIPTGISIYGTRVAKAIRARSEK